MKLIKSSYEIIPQDSTLDGIYKHIELCSRVAYKSEDRITENSAKKFVDRIINNKHYATIEHGTVYLNIINPDDIISCQSKYTKNKYSKVYKNTLENSWGSPHLYITTNLRVLVENNWMEDLKYICKPTKYHEKRVTVRLILDRAIAMEFLRHRKFSFTMESTRYCNYSKDRFGNELTFIIPCWANDTALQEVKGTIINHDEYGNLIGEYYYHLTGKGDLCFKPCEITPERNFIVNLQISEQLYLELLNQGWKPQQARVVLPNALKTELIMTGFIEDWKHFFNLRCNSSAHPQAQELAIPLLEEFNKRNLLT